MIIFPATKFNSEHMFDKTIIKNFSRKVNNIKKRNIFKISFQPICACGIGDID